MDSGKKETRMTIKQFLNEMVLIRKDARFYLSGDKYVMSADQLCPIQELATQRDIAWEDVNEAGECLGLSPPSIRQIIDAADGKSFGGLRKRLLAACGISLSPPERP